MSSALDSIAELPQEAVLLVLQLLARAFAYCILAFSTLVDFPATSGSRAALVRRDLEGVLARWKNRRELIHKYLERVEQLASLEEMMAVFENLWEFVHPQIVAMLDELRLVESEPAGALAGVKRCLMGALFHDSNFLGVLQFLSDEKLGLLLASLTTATLDRFHAPDSFGVHTNTVVQINRAIESAGKLFRLDEALRPGGDPTTIKCFELSMAKELAFDPKLEPERHENAILKCILKNELGDSPQSFDDEQCRILDFQQVFTFHCSSIHEVYRLSALSMALTVQKVRHYVGAGHSPVREPLRLLDDLRSATLRSKTAYDTRIRRLVQQGTLGLSRWLVLFDTIGIVRDFLDSAHSYPELHTSILAVIRDDPRAIPDMSLFKEEDHFVKIYRQYCALLSRCLSLISSAKPTQPLDVNIDVGRLEELDSNIKDTYYTLVYFEQRFGYEARILEQLGKRVDMAGPGQGSAAVLRGME